MLKTKIYFYKNARDIVFGVDRAKSISLLFNPVNLMGLGQS